MHGWHKLRGVCAESGVCGVSMDGVCMEGRWCIYEKWMGCAWKQISLHEWHVLGKQMLCSWKADGVCVCARVCKPDGLYMRSEWYVHSNQVEFMRIVSAQTKDGVRMESR